MQTLTKGLRKTQHGAMVSFNFFYDNPKTPFEEQTQNL